MSDRHREVLEAMQVPSPELSAWINRKDSKPLKAFEVDEIAKALMTVSDLDAMRFLRMCYGTRPLESQVIVAVLKSI